MWFIDRKMDVELILEESENIPLRRGSYLERENFKKDYKKRSI